MAFYQDAGATRADATLVGSYLQVLTHAVVAAAFVFFYTRRAYYAGALALATLVNSGMYHICKAQWFCFGVEAVGAPGASILALSGLERLRLLDHINSLNTAAGGLLIVAFSDGGGGPHTLAYRALLPLVAAFAELAFPFQTKADVVVIIYVVLVVGLEYLWVRAGRLPLRDRFNLRFLIPGLVIGAAAFAFYAGVGLLHAEIEHSLWHIFIFVALWLIVLGVNQIERS